MLLAQAVFNSIHAPGAEIMTVAHEELDPKLTIITTEEKRSIIPFKADALR